MYSEEQKNTICEAIFLEIEGGASLRNILLRSDMPSSQTFYKWIEEDQIKSKQYARACNYRADFLFEEILEIADENDADCYLDEEGNTKVNGNNIQRSRLKVDARKWMVGKLNPKKYGDKVESTQIIKTEEMTPEERASRIAELMKKSKIK